MRPDQLGDYSTPSDVRLHPDGKQAAFVVTTMDLEEDRYVRRAWLWDGSEARPVTTGPSDTTPRWVPDGSRLAFLRKGEAEDDRPQVAVLPLRGGEARVLTSFDLGVTELAWSPDGDSIAVVAWEYTPEWADLERDARAAQPRRITRLPFRFDNVGWLDDRRHHVWLVDPEGDEAPRCLTPGDDDESAIVWHPEGERLAFTSARHGTRGLDAGTQVWEVDGDGGDPAARTDPGLWSQPQYDRAGRLHVIGRPGLSDHPSVYPLWRIEEDGAMTDLTGDLDRSLVTFAPALDPGGPRWLEDGSFFTTLEDEGRIRVIHRTTESVTSDVIGGDRAITGFDPRPDGSAAAFIAVAPTDPGEVWWWDETGERQLTELNTAFREQTALSTPERFTIEHEDAVVEGWAYLPEGEDRVPLLLNIHGGPATQYGYTFFDEFQVYTGAGYGVVAINPRGSSGYGQDHVRAVVGTWADETPPDLRDLLAAPDAAASRFARLDTGRMGVMGGSYGGFATVRVLASDHRYASAVAERGLYTWTSFTGTSDIGPWFDGSYLGVQPPEGWSTLWEASPLACAHHIETPTLVLHSERDWRCPIEQAEQLFTLLLRNGVDTELVRFPDEGHEMSRGGKPQHRQTRFEMVLAWHGPRLGVDVEA